MTTWYALVRHEEPPGPGCFYPPKGFPIAIHADKERLEMMGKPTSQFKIVPVVPLDEMKQEKPSIKDQPLVIGEEVETIDDICDGFSNLVLTKGMVGRVYGIADQDGYFRVRMDGGNFYVLNISQVKRYDGYPPRT